VLKGVRKKRQVVKPSLRGRSQIPPDLVTIVRTLAFVLRRLEAIGGFIAEQ
jgi:hypothetical protein